MLAVAVTHFITNHNGGIAMAAYVRGSLPNLVKRGKVRDLYELDANHYLMVASDDVSAFDSIVGAIPDKGILLTRMSAFWFRLLEKHHVHHHMVALADDEERTHIWRSAPAFVGLPAKHRSRAMMVRRAQRIDVECVVRGYLVGSAWKEYTTTGQLLWDPKMQGKKIREGDRLPNPLFTPTTKAEKGHDESLSIPEVERRIGFEVARELREKAHQIYHHAATYARNRGILILDTKLEFGWSWPNRLCLIDEAFTPDSSRFTWERDWKPGGPQPSLDKEVLRRYLTEAGWDQQPPAPLLPPEVIERTRDAYIAAYEALTGERFIV